MALENLVSPADRARGVLLVGCAGFLWSTLGLGVRLMEEATAWQIVFYRGLFQAIAIVGLVLYRNPGDLREPFRQMGWTGMLGAMALAISYNGMIVALSLTSVATVVFLLSAAPFVTAVLGWLVLREPVRPVTFATMGCALLGIFVMTTGTPAGGNRAGLLAAAITVLGYSVFTVSLRKAKDVDMLPMIALSGVLAALMSAVGIDSFAMTGRDLALSAYLGAVSLAGGLALFAAGARVLTAAELPLVAMTESVLAPAWVWLFLGETVTGATLLGGAIVLGAVAAQGFATARPSPGPDTAAP